MAPQSQPRTTTVLVCLLLAAGAAGQIQLATIHDLPSGTPPPPLTPPDKGYAVAMIGDVDGDGHGDFVYSEPSHNLGAGRVRMLSGLDASLLWTATGENFGDGFGTGVALAGDPNGDGTPDVVVGAPYFGNRQGRVYVLAGATGAIQLTRDGVCCLRDFGYSVGGNIDFDGNGTDDIVVGAPTYGALGINDAGAYYVYDGDNGNLLQTTNNVIAGGDGERMGHAVAGAGDFNGDGRGDVVIGTPFHDNAAGVDAGRIQVVGYVPDGMGGATITVLAEVFGPGAGSAFGSAVAGMGDANRDGLDDVVVGAPSAVGAGSPFTSGAAFVLAGPIGAVLHNIAGGIRSATGFAVSGAGDVDGDDFPDFIVGRPGPGLLSNQPGSITVHSGLTGALLDTFPGQGGAGSAYGFSVGGGVDVDHDFLSDVIVGDPDDERVEVLGFPLTRPGSHEDLHLQAATSSERLTRLPDSRSAGPGDVMRLRLRSYGDYNGTIPAFLVQLFPTGSPPAGVAGFPELHFDLTGVAVLFDGSIPTPFGLPVLPPGGMSFGYLVPPGLAGFNALFQGIVLAASSFTGNVFFTASEAQVFTFTG